MRQFKRYGLATGLATLLVLGLVGCGGSGTGNQTPRVSYSSVVSFGDSLSDPGAYKVGPVAGLGGGLFTVNGITGDVGADPSPTYTWAQLVAAAVVGTPSCAARTGGFGVSATTVAGCTNYAQGGSRVTDAVGTGYDGANGPMTEPVVTQVTNYLASTSNGRFTGRELVTVQGGANDLFAQSRILQETIMAIALSEGPEAANTYATTIGPATAVAGMVTAAIDLSNSVKGMLTSGATRIVVSNLPDVSQTPFALALDTPSLQLVTAMTLQFNARLRTELAGVSGVLFVDVFDENQKQIENPHLYGLSNVTDTACNLNYGVNPFATPGNADGSSLVCNSSNLIAGNTSRYLFADGVHPTPYGHKLLSQLIIKQLVLAGWL